MKRITNKKAGRIIRAAIEVAHQDTRIHRDVLIQGIPAARAALAAVQGSISRRDADRIAYEAIAARWNGGKCSRRHGWVERSSWELGSDTVIGCLGWSAI